MKNYKQHKICNWWRQKKQSVTDICIVFTMFVRIQYSVINLPCPKGWGEGGRTYISKIVFQCTKLFLCFCFRKFIWLSVGPLICLQTMIAQTLIILYRMTENLPPWHVYWAQCPSPSWHVNEYEALMGWEYWQGKTKIRGEQPISVSLCLP